MDLSDKRFFVLISIIVILGFGILTYCAFEEYEIEKEIIKQSEGYVKFNHCTHIQGKYYCKD